MAKDTVIGIIGMGHVGAHVANALLFRGLAGEIRCVDKQEDKLRAEVNEYRDAMPFYPRVAQVHNCHDHYEDLLDCDIIINAAGQVSACAGSRDGELFITAEETKSFAPRLKGFAGVVVSIANPCDVIATMLWKLSGLDPHQIVGSGTALDSARLRHALWDETGYSPESICAWMLGEHGNSQFAAWSHVQFGGVNLADLEKNDPEHFHFDHAEIEDKARQGGYVTFNVKNCTEYAIANTTASLVAAIAGDTRLITPVGTLMDNYYGESGFFTSVPCVLGKNGVERVFPFELSEDEQKAFHASCAHIKENIERVKCW